MTQITNSEDKEKSIILEELKKIQQKIESAPALNGSFTSLVEAVDEIKLSQSMIGNDMAHLKESHKEVKKSVDNINESLNKPDTGIFSQLQTIRDSQTTQIQKITAVDKDVQDTKVAFKKVYNDDIIVAKEKVLVQNEKIKQFEDWRNRTSKVYMTLFMTIATATIGLLIKTIYDLVVSGSINL